MVVVICARTFNPIAAPLKDLLKKSDLADLAFRCVENERNGTGPNNRTYGESVFENRVRSRSRHTIQID